MLIDKVRETVEKHGLIEKNQHIVLGLSGGPDSMCLFDVLMSLRDEMGIEIHPVHVNHMIRPGDADEDQAYVEGVCRARGTECTVYVRDCPAIAREEGMTSEEAGRKVRYDAFYETAEKITDELVKSEGISRVEAVKRVRIAVAHNSDDQTETVLFRLIRGTGTDGLAGMAYRRRERGFEVIRPVLDVSREEIEEYCRERKLEPVTDETNSKGIYTRNRIRLDLLPMLEREYNENMKATLLRLAAIAAEDSGYIWRQTEKAYREGLKGYPKEDAALDREGVVLDRAYVAGLDDAVRHRVLMKAFADAGLEKDISSERIKAADRIIGKKQAPKTVEFPHGYRLTVARGKIIIYRQVKVE